ELVDDGQVRLRRLRGARQLQRVRLLVRREVVDTLTVLVGRRAEVLRLRDGPARVPERVLEEKEMAGDRRLRLHLVAEVVIDPGARRRRLAGARAGGALVVHRALVPVAARGAV